MLVWKLIQLPKLFLFSFFYFSIFLIVLTAPIFYDTKEERYDLWTLDDSYYYLILHMLLFESFVVSLLDQKLLIEFDKNWGCSKK
jgi:hypothetical protein